MAGKRTQAKTKGRKKRMGTMDFILLIVFLCLTVFTIAMIALFTVYGSVPDTLITSCSPRWAASAASSAG